MKYILILLSLLITKSSIAKQCEDIFLPKQQIALPNGWGISVEMADKFSNLIKTKEQFEELAIKASEINSLPKEFWEALSEALHEFNPTSSIQSEAYKNEQISLDNIFSKFNLHMISRESILNELQSHPRSTFKLNNFSQARIDSYIKIVADKKSNFIQLYKAIEPALDFSEAAVKSRLNTEIDNNASLKERVEAQGEESLENSIQHFLNIEKSNKLLKTAIARQKNLINLLFYEYLDIFHSSIADMNISSQHELSKISNEFIESNTQRIFNSEYNYIYELLMYSAGNIKPSINPLLLKNNVEEKLKSEIKHFKHQYKSELRTPTTTASQNIKSRPVYVMAKQTNHENISTRNPNKRRRRASSSRKGKVKPTTRTNSAVDQQTQENLLIDSLRAVSIDEITSNTHNARYEAGQYYYFKFRNMKPGYDGIQFVQMSDRVAGMFNDPKKQLQNEQWMSKLTTGFAPRKNGTNGIKELIGSGRTETWWEVKIVRNSRRMLMKKDGKGHWYIFDISDHDKID